MPEAARVFDAHRLAVNDLVRQHHDLRVSFQQVLFGNVYLQWTETAAEIDMLFFAELLIAKQQYAALVKGLA